MTREVNSLNDATTGLQRTVDFIAKHGISPFDVLMPREDYERLGRSCDGVAEALLTKHGFDGWRANQEGILAIMNHPIGRPDDPRLPGVIHNSPGLGNRPAFAGTRIQVSDIMYYLWAGRPHDAILAAYPILTQEDIDAAIAFGFDDSLPILKREATCVMVFDDRHQIVAAGDSDAMALQCFVFAREALEKRFGR